MIVAVVSFVILIGVLVVIFVMAVSVSIIY